MNVPKLDPVFEVFICHHRSPEEDAIATALARRLEAFGISVFTDLGNIGGGESFRRKINDTLPETRLVVAIFSENYSDWQVAEAGCAFLDAKLMPVCLGIQAPPAPFQTLNAHQLPPHEEPDHEEALSRVAGEVHRRLRGERRGLGFHLARKLNHAFAHGLPYIYLCIVPLVIWALSHSAASWREIGYDVLKYLHVIAGMLTLGGGILLSVGFARAFSSRSYRGRQAGFHTANGLFLLWLTVAVLTLVLGFATAYFRDYLTAPWVQYSIYLYFLALMFWGGGYFLVYMAHQADRQHRVELFVKMRALASICFLVGFVLTVMVADLMFAKPYWLGQSGS